MRHGRGGSENAMDAHTLMETGKQERVMYITYRPLFLETL